MSQLKIPKIRYLCQDAAGHIWVALELPYTYEDDGDKLWLGADKILLTGKPNPNWKDALVDLNKERYEVVDGILIVTGKKVKKAKG